MDTPDLASHLRERFGHEAFRPGQREVVEAVLAGEDVVAVMPTGGGKSLCYQLPALLLEGLTLVVSPLIALMKDQVDALRELGHDATFVNSTLSAGAVRKRLRECAEGRHRLLYIAPERLGSPRFLEALGEMTVARLAIDEAHCISQWGHDFRPDYLRLGELRQAIGSPPTAAFTATATREVRADVVAQLRLDGPRVFVAGFERPNLRLLVRRFGRVAEKLDILDASIAEAGTPAIVYAATRKNVELLADHLARSGLSAGAYHAGLDGGERTRVQDAFMAGDMDVIAATNAFGMGVDKADIRLVVHYDLPGSVEAYYQEAGRAGRDGAAADCVLIYNYADVRIQQFFLDGSNPEPDLYRGIIRRLAEGPATLRDLRNWTGQRNPMAVDTAVGTLRRLGAAHRDMDPGTGEDVFVAGDLPEDGSLPLDEESIRAKRQAAEERLRLMCGYAAGASCRRAYILHYFGSDEARERCDHCDRCLELGRPGARELSAEERRFVRIALSGVARVNDRYGRSRIAQFLIGSKARQVIEAGLHELPTHGKLAGLPLRVVGDLLEALADEGLLARRSIDGPGSGAVLSLTAEGARVMQEDPPLTLAIASLTGTLTGASTATRGSRPRSGLRAAGAAADADVNPLVAERLRVWRAALAKERGLPAYTIFPDRTLHALASILPANEAELLAIPGIGPARLERYGDAILDVMKDGDGNVTEASA